ncbi:MAG: class I SAM-dependent methyltransferase, partial [Deltaproteobacteria bacterium]|nr:class I SAM-dependent methyltransferase [Deltaproteobacteria bacterium]
MNEQEVNKYLADRLGVKPELVPYFVELQRDKVIINPLLPDSIRQLGRSMDLSSGQRVLDLACGKAGVSLPLVLIYKVELLGIDILPEFIRQAWSRAEASGLYHLCDFINDDAAQFVEKTKSTWDAVLMLGASFIWENLEGALKVLPKLVSPGGHLVIGEPYYKPEAKKLPEMAFLSKEETTARMEKTGQVIEIIDDGEKGWQETYV